MIKNIIWFLCTLSYFLLGCMEPGTKEDEDNENTILSINKEDSSISLTTLEKKSNDYFKTSDTEVDTLNNVLILTITKVSDANLEALVSTFAVKISDAISSFDSIIFITSGIKDTYAYKTGDLLKVKDNIDEIGLFSEQLNSKNIEECRGLFSVEINSNPDEFNKFISSAFLDYKIIKIELAGVRIVNNKYTIYCNFFYSNNFIQTYQFVFVNNSRKIYGINVPKNDSRPVKLGSPTLN